MNFHIPTLLVVTIILCAGMSISLLLVWRFVLRERALLPWGAAQGSFAVGLLLMAQRERLPDFWTIIVANSFNLACYALIWWAVCEYRRRPFPVKSIIGTGILFAGSFPYYTYVEPNIMARIAVMHTLIPALMIGAAAALFRGRAGERIGTEIVAGLSFLMDAGFRLLVLGLVFTNPSAANPLHSNQVIAMTMLATIVSFIVWGLAVIMMVLDGITRQLADSSNLLQSVLDAIPVRVFWKDVDSRYLGCNLHFALDAGLSSSGAIIGQTDDDFAWRSQANSYRQDDRQVIATGQPKLHYEELMPLAEKQQALVRTSKVPLRNAKGVIVGIVGAYEDISARKKMEDDRDKLQMQMNQVQKMESVGRLAGGVAHDFNNMLTVIIGNTELALSQVAPDLPLHADLQEILKAGQRSANLTRQLLAYARKQEASPKVLDLNQTVAEMIKMLTRLIGENNDLVWAPDPTLWLVKIDPSQVDQILTNLCVNARDAIAGGGRITIKTENVVFTERDCAAIVEAVPGEYVVLAVHDDGCGMEKEMQGKVFEPFFTSKGVGEGTGLGLATVYGIVKQNNGFVSLFSEPGQGTTIKVYLPRSSGQGEPEMAKSSSGSSHEGHETILLVEDDPSILQMIKNILSKQGYQVLIESSPSQACALADDRGGQIDLLITDVVMPEMNGRELATRLLAGQPTLKCLFISGYTDDIIAQHGVLHTAINFLPKPFTPKEIVAKVRAVLDS